MMPTRWPTRRPDSFGTMPCGTASACGTTASSCSRTSAGAILPGPCTGLPGLLPRLEGRRRRRAVRKRAVGRDVAFVSPGAYVGWAMEVPDQYRADFVLRELREFEAQGEFPQLVLICLPNDHTSGTKRGCPTPAATVADNDLAFGRIVEGLSRSKFWPQMAILAIEDDPQNGWDHVSGYRTTAYVASPYARRRTVVSSQYNTTSLLRTIEQILGLPPMNQFDASAEPMRDCFTDTPDFTPFTALPSNIPLDQMNGDPQSLRDPQLRADALACEQMNFDQVDHAPEDALNRVLWRASRNRNAISGMGRPPGRR